MNREYGTMIKLIHIPTGLTWVATEWRCGIKQVVECTRRCRSMIAAKLAKRAEDPRWIDVAKSTERVRSYHLHTYLEVPPYTKDERTGHRHPLDYSIFQDGKIDHLLKDSASR